MWLYFCCYGWNTFYTTNENHWCRAKGFNQDRQVESITNYKVYHNDDMPKKRLLMIISIEAISKRLKYLAGNVESASMDAWSGEFSEYDIVSSHLDGFLEALELIFDSKTFNEIKNRAGLNDEIL